MLGGQSPKSLHPTKIKNILTQRCINKYRLFVEKLVENYIRINVSLIFDINAYEYLLTF